MTTTSASGEGSGPGSSSSSGRAWEDPSSSTSGAGPASVPVGATSRGGFAVFASKGGAPTNPDWYRNLVAHPGARVEVGTETFDVTARVATGEERERIWTEQKRRIPGFAEYERRTPRQIPVVILEPTP